MASVTVNEDYTKPRKPANAGPGWYKSFANGIQPHYNNDYIDIEKSEQENTNEERTLSEELPELPSGQFYVERLMAKRVESGRTEYLVLWMGWPKESAQWVNEHDISSELIRKFNHLVPHDCEIREAVGNFTSALDRHDVYRFLFNDKTELAFGDFKEQYFPLGWNQWCKQYGKKDNPSYYGRTIVFPLKVHCYLQWTRPNSFIKLPDGTTRQKQKIFLEMIRVYVIKDNF